MEFNIDIDKLSETQQALVAEYAGLLLDATKLDTPDPLIAASFKVLTTLRSSPVDLDALEFQQLVDRCIDKDIQAVKELVRLGKRIRAEK